MPQRGDQRPDQHPLTFYPAYCYRNSPTWFVWVKLTCFEVHNVLQPGPTQTQTYASGRKSNFTLFYLNHPIQYAQITGLIVAINDSKDTVFVVTLDDSSGSTLDIVIRKPRPQPAHISTTTTFVPPSLAINNYSATTAAAPPARLSEEQTNALTLLTQLRGLPLGTLVRAKGTLTTFYSTRQLSVLRATTLTSTTAELALIAARTAFNTTVLSKPWTVTKSQQEKLLRIERGEKVETGARERRQRQRKTKIEEREKRHEAVIARQWDREERDRAKAAEVARRDGEWVKERSVQLAVKPKGKN